MLWSEQHDSITFTHAQHRGEDAKDHYLNDSVVALLKELKTSAKDMTIQKWMGVFTDTGSFLGMPSELSRKLRSFG